MAQRGGLIVSSGSAVGLSEDGMDYPVRSDARYSPLEDAQRNIAGTAATSSNPSHISDDHENADGGHSGQSKGHA